MDAHTENLHRHLKREEQWIEAQEVAMRRLDEGDFTFDDFIAGCREYWPQIKHCLSEKDEQEAHTFIEKGLLDRLTQKELDRD